jgi:hypothetical protein
MFLVKKILLSASFWCVACIALGQVAFGATLSLENFEFADSTVNAQAGIVITPFGTANSGSVDSGSGVNATQGTYSLAATLNFGVDAFNDVRLRRNLSSPITLGSPLSLAALGGCSIKLDIKGDANLGDKNLIVFLVDSDGEKFRFISANDTSLNGASFSSDHTILFTDADPYEGVQTDDTLTQIVAVEIDFQDNTTGAVAAETGTVYIDNLRLQTIASNYRTLSMDGDMSDWVGIAPAAGDPSGDGGSGRDVKAVYLANDSTNLYVRIESYNADGYDGNEYSGVDGDASSATGFSLFGLPFGSDTLVAGASLYSEQVGNFNSGAATPGSVSWGPFSATTDLEYAIPLNTVITGDITQSFPGGLGSVIKFAYGDGNGGAGDTITPVSYLLASPTPNIYHTMTIDGDASDWTGLAPVATDVSGDGGTGRDVAAIYLANDAANLYIRIQSYNSDAFDGNEFIAIDGDNSSATGFNLFGVGAGCDTLLAGASIVGESTSNFNTGAATPATAGFAPGSAATELEIAVPLNTVLPAGTDILQSFPGGVGSQIKVVFGDSNGGATDVVGPVSYTLASTVPVELSSFTAE